MTRADEIAAALKNVGSRVALLCHRNPDGDTIGSALALRLALQTLGIQTSVLCVNPVPGTLRMLSGANEVCDPHVTETQTWNALIPIDCASVEQTGMWDDEHTVFDVLSKKAATTLLIDHHASNAGYCQTNWVDGSKSAVGLMVYQVIGALNVALTVDMAACLYAAISTDTGNYSHGNTSAEAFRVTADLMDAGLELTRWNRMLFVEKTLPEIMLRARAESNLRFLHAGELAVMTLCQADFDACDARQEHAENLVNIGLSVKGTRISVFARQWEDSVRVSLRALAPDRVDLVAKQFGGGGHPQASGLTIRRATMESALSQIITALERVLDGETG